jgi:phosphate transport system permease protein
MRKNSLAKDPLSRILRLSVHIAVTLTIATLVLIVSYILIMGIPHLRLSLFSPTYTSENASMLPAIITTVIVILVALGVSVPLGIGCALFLVEYSGKTSPWVRLIRLTAETLAGIPSIVYGLFGMLFFVTALHWGFSVLAGSFTLSMMILPLIMRTAEEALLSVPDTLREASFGLGAGRLRTILKVVLPSAVPGILAGVILAIGRIVGETAALIYTAGTVAQVPSTLLESGRTLAIHMYALSSEGLHTEEAYATAVVLLIIVLAINTLAAVIAKAITKTTGASNE